MSVDALDLIRTLSKQNDELNDANAHLEVLVKWETKEVEEKLEKLDNGSGDDTRGRPTWPSVAILVGVAFVVGMKVARQKDAGAG
jgi:hypothetical protein